MSDPEIEFATRLLTIAQLRQQQCISAADTLRSRAEDDWAVANKVAGGLYILIAKDLVSEIEARYPDLPLGPPLDERLISPLPALADPRAGLLPEPQQIVANLILLTQDDLADLIPTAKTLGADVQSWYHKIRSKFARDISAKLYNPDAGIVFGQFVRNDS